MTDNSFKPLKQRRYSDEVLNQLKDAILTGKYSAGDKLPSERELIESFKVSRVVVREALRALEMMGFVSIRQGATGGAYVNDLTFDRLSDACTDLFLANKLSLPELQHARLIIEPMIARLAAQRISPEAVKRIHKAVLQEQGKDKKYSGMVVKRSKVHYVLAEMCGNRFLEAIVKSLLLMVKDVIEKFEPEVDAIHPAGLHGKIIEAVIAGDSEAAYQAMHEHLLVFGENLENAEKKYRGQN